MTRKVEGRANFQWLAPRVKSNKVSRLLEGYDQAVWVYSLWCMLYAVCCMIVPGINDDHSRLVSIKKQSQITIIIITIIIIYFIS